MPPPQPIVVFDFDGTLTTRDSLLPFLLLATGGPLPFLARLLRALPTSLPRALATPTRDNLKELILAATLRGTPLPRLQSLANHFAAHTLPRLHRPPLLERLRHHQTQSHRILLLSASPELYLRPWAAAHAIHEVLATRLQFDPSGIFTGRLDGPNCRGPEKLRRLQAHLAPTPLHQLHLIAYGDAPSDRFVMQAAREPYLVTPDSQIRPFPLPP